MSSTGQAFVKSFARRRRVQEQGTPAASGPPAVPVANPSVAQRPMTGGPGAVRVDQSVAASARLWIDVENDQTARADSAHASPPIAHVEPPVEPTPIEPLPVEAVPVEPLPVDEKPSVQAKAVVVTADQGDAVSAESNLYEVMAALQHSETAYAEIAPELHEHIASGIGESTTAAESLPVAKAEPSDSVETELPEPAQTNPIVSAAPVAEEPSSAIDAPAASLAAIEFRAVWEVDVFDVPTTVADLFFEAGLFQDLSSHLREAVANGMRSMMVTSVQSGEGRSSVAIGIAIAAAAAGVRVALLDADLDDPTLADDFRLELEYGWLDTIRRGLPIKEVAVHAVEDAVTLIPLMPRFSGTGRSQADDRSDQPPMAAEAVRMIELLKTKFDLVVIDGPAGSFGGIGALVGRVDSAIVVHDPTRTDDGLVSQYCEQLRAAGVQGVGLVENFVDPSNM